MHPRQDVTVETVLKPAEIVTGVTVPGAMAAWRSTYFIMPTEAAVFEPDLWVFCARTLTPQGPDGFDVHLEDCQPGRGCWRDAPRRS